MAAATSAVTAIETVSDTRDQLTKHLERFRAARMDGTTAAPVVFGSRRKPEAALIPIELLDLIADRLEDLRLAELTTERLVNDTGARYTLEDAAAMLGVDLNAL